VLFGIGRRPDIFIQAVRRGIAGYVLKNASATDLLEAVRTVAQGEATCPPKFCKVLFKALAGQATTIKTGAFQSIRTHSAPTTTHVSSRHGSKHKEIAANLNLSEFTVKNHIYRVMKQVDAQSRHEAVSLIGDID